MPPTRAPITTTTIARVRCRLLTRRSSLASGGPAGRGSRVDHLGVRRPLAVVPAQPVACESEAEGPVQVSRRRGARRRAARDAEGADRRAERDRLVVVVLDHGVPAAALAVAVAVVEVRD